uniref:Uncharacterized protein n=1 Tax=Aegilops tauschii subsp. strangulata TaxID=200361 RepID=A0A453P235_AEGTS
YKKKQKINLQMQAEMLVIEKNSPANGIIKLIEQHHITNHVMGTSSFSPCGQTKYSFVTRH